MKSVLAAATLFLLAGCTPSPVPGSNPTDMTITEHRQEAATHSDEVRMHQELEQARLSREFGTGFSHASQVFTHERHAKAHRNAALELEKMNAAACSGIPVNRLSYCPLMDPTVSKKVVTIPGGVQVVMDSTSIGGIRNVEAHVKCHLVFGQGYAVAKAGCPLYLKGVQATVRGTDRETIVTTESADPRDSMLLQSWGASVSEDRTRKAVTQTVETPEPKAPAQGFTCPMHPEVVQKEPGRCTKCGMTLEPKK